MTQTNHFSLKHSFWPKAISFDSAQSQIVHCAVRKFRSRTFKWTLNIQAKCTLFVAIVAGGPISKYVNFDAGIFGSAFVTFATVIAMCCVAVLRHFRIKPGVSKQKQPAPAHPNSPGRLNVLSYNIFLMPPFSPCCVHKAARLEEFKKRVLPSAYDIVLLQECFGTFSLRRAAFLSSCRELGFDSIAAPQPLARLEAALVDGGLVMLSRFAIAASDYHTFRSATKSDLLAAKGVLYGLVYPHGEGRPGLHVFNTHLQASYLPAAEEPATRAIRAQQIAEIVAFIQRKVAEHPGFPVLFGGDLNLDSTDESSAEYAGLIRQLGALGRARDLVCEGHGGRHPVTCHDWSQTPRETVLTPQETYDSFERDSSYDYIFLIDPDRHHRATSSSTHMLDKRAGSTPSPPFRLDRACVEPFLVADEPTSERPFTHLSDHSAVAVSLTAKRFS